VAQVIQDRVKSSQKARFPVRDFQLYTPIDINTVLTDFIYVNYLSLK